MGYQVNIQRLEVNAVFDMQGQAAAIADWCENALPEFPEQPNTSSAKDGLSLYWIGPSRWLLRANSDREQELLSITKPDKAPAEISIVQISDTLQFFAIRGPDTEEVMSIASPLDHHLSAFPPNGVTYTDVFGVKGLLIRSQEGFEVGVERSFGDMIEDCLVRAIT